MIYFVLFLKRLFIDQNPLRLTAHPLVGTKMAHITFSPKQTGTFMLAVHATEIRCKFNIWACATKDVEVEAEQPSIVKVNKLLRKFDILSQHDLNTIDIHFPRS